VIGGHPGGEVGGGFVMGLGEVATPMHKEAVGQTGEDTVNPDRVGLLQPALIVAA